MSQNGNQFLKSLNLLSMKRPYFSIITATYNSEENIKGCIDSIKSQTFKDFEHVVIDGLSSDNTINVIKANQIENQVVVSEKDRGIYDALNKGIDRSNGKFIVFLHSDDVFFESTTLQKIYDFLEDKQCDGLWGNLIYVDKKSGRTVRRWRDNKFRSLYLGWMPPHPTLVIKKEIYDEIGNFDTKFKIAGDYDFCVRLFNLDRYNIKNLDNTLIKMSLGGESNKSINNLFKKTKEDLVVIKKLGSIFIYLILIFKIGRKIFQFRFS